ncbi:ankyrin repeat domain-containing protein [Fictibacillus nanhaiensis]|uniref:ankyrin repeat domain-containing protein n=1 Tax=Fictibacillus nanhaiensis TaxID=742169 RepID=UPI001C98ADFF|nr:ankyrin repeat domain-containing protein [Fictibacillus nanhaiensis]MBY6035742.1 ankyrin repeat domain-containing protein [Fictibacillus nanhaiensis]
MSLHKAVMDGNLEEVHGLLLDEQVDVNELQDGWSPLHLAAHFGHTELVALLLKNGADVQLKSHNEMANTPLHAAAANKSNRQEMLLLLVSHGASINEKQSGGWTVLHQAAHHNDPEMLLFYLDHGADPFTAKDDGKTALELAEEEGCEDAASVLRNYTLNKI